MPCPMDKKEFTLPSNGVSDLPKNYAVDNCIVKLNEWSPSYCDQHRDKSIELYCFECKTAICALCCISAHNGHSCSDVSLPELQRELREQMTTDAGKVAAGVDKCREMLRRLENEKDDFSTQVAKAEMQINRKVEHLRQMSLMKRMKVDEIERLREEVGTRLASLESYQKFVNEQRQKGTACDVARAGSGLHDRADELLKFVVTLADLGHADVTFTSSNYVMDDVNKTLGQLHTFKQGGLIYF